jgi:acetyl-CoA C-acetyltransferase
VSLASRTPVIVGVGQSAARLGEPGYRRRAPVDLAADAAREAILDTGADAGADSGGNPGAVAAAIDTVAVIRQLENSTPGPRAPLCPAPSRPRSRPR